jgi:DnaK suppressor protein
MATKSTKEAPETSAETVIKKTVTAKAASKTAKPVDDNTPLTEEQLLKMPESDYMNAAQIAFFRARLRVLEQDLLSNAGATTENLRETQFVPDPADRATIEEEHAIELRTRDRERKLLKKVQQCISRLDSGEYGWCEETGEPISLRRLLARPTATLSLEAQERREMRQKMFGD